MKIRLLLEIVILLFFLVVEIALFNISINLNQLKILNENLISIHNTMIEQNKILGYNPEEDIKNENV